MVDRIDSGIPGLDELIEGGLPKGSTTLVSGSAGTGKTMFCSQFLWQGLQNDEKCLFITVEENSEDILEDAKEFGWDFEDYDDSFKIEYLNPFQIRGDLADQMPMNNRINSLIQKLGADRVVIDSVSVLGMRAEDKSGVRQQLYELIELLKDSGVTAVLTAEIPEEDSEKLSRYGVEEFVTDGVIKLEYISLGSEAFGHLEVRKMRRTKIEKGKYETDIGENGLEVNEETIDIK